MSPRPSARMPRFASHRGTLYLRTLGIGTLAAQHSNRSHRVCCRP
jgi:hypothetical protein